MKLALLTIGILAVALMVWKADRFVKLIHYTTTPSYYHVVVVNGDSARLVSGEVRVNRKRYPIGALDSGSSKSFEVPVRADGQYVVSTSWSDGSTAIDSTGYVTHGMPATDSIEVRRNGLRQVSVTDSVSDYLGGVGH